MSLSIVVYSQLVKSVKIDRDKLYLMLQMLRSKLRQFFRRRHAVYDWLYVRKLTWVLFINIAACFPSIEVGITDNLLHYLNDIGSSQLERETEFSSDEQD